MKVIPPELGTKSFSCPHCGAIAQQTWFRVFLDYCKADQKLEVLTLDQVNKLDLKRIEDEYERKKWETIRKNLEKHVLVITTERFGHQCPFEIINAAVSYCFSCEGFALWVEDRLVYPARNAEIEPHEEMPDSIKADFNEAASIVDKSPRGAAALLRLCIQKLMPILNEKGKNINEDIASLVKKGLSPMVQKALDAVRVTGNNAVHPGNIDLKDDKATAIRLFGLVNVIVESMIAVPKRIEGKYDALPAEQLAQIEKRDNKP